MSGTTWTECQSDSILIAVKAQIKFSVVFSSKCTATFFFKFQMWYSISVDGRSISRSIKWYRSGLLVSHFLSILSDSLSWEKVRQKNQSNFAKLKLTIDKVYSLTKKATWQFGRIGFLVNFIIQELKFWKIAQFF